MMYSDDEGDREASPDWIRTFQTPSRRFVTTLSSSSDSSHDGIVKEETQGDDDYEHVSGPSATTDGRDPDIVDLDRHSESDEEAGKAFSSRSKSSKKKLLKQKDGVKSPSLGKKVKKEDVNASPLSSGKDVAIATAPRNAGNLSKPKNEDDDHVLLKEEKNVSALQDDETHEGLEQERRVKQRVASSLPFVFADKLHRSKVLVECEEDDLDLSGDVGAVGRFSVSSGNGKEDHDILLDLKGVIYKATIVPSNTFFVVNIGQTEAKVEAMMNDFVQLQPSTNFYEAETMVEGTLEGFDLESDDDVGAQMATGTNITGKEGDGSKGEEKSNKKKKLPIKTSSKAAVSKSGKAKRNAKGAGKAKKGGIVRKTKPGGSAGKNSKKKD